MESVRAKDDRFVAGLTTSQVVTSPEWRSGCGYGIDARAIASDPEASPALIPSGKG